MSSPARTLSAKNFFSPRGILSQWHPNYEHRPGQLEMAKAVEEAIQEKRTLLVEAGTGTGKTLAYLIPAIFPASGSLFRPARKISRNRSSIKTFPFCSSTCRAVKASAT